MRPATLERSISPPPSSRKTLNIKADPTNCDQKAEAAAQQDKPHPGEHLPASIVSPTLAAIEAGQAQIRDHLDYFTKHLSIASRPHPTNPRIGLDDFRELYVRNQHPDGCHYVIHQHDHPISGVHYDLRLQFSKTSTISFAIPYGLPGNPNSIRPNRMAIETRVHNLWNNLIESASHATGSLLIWDTGEYEVIPKAGPQVRTTDDELSDALEEDSPGQEVPSQSATLNTAFKRRHIHLRLRGTRLPPGYTIALRLSSTNGRDNQQRRPRIKRRRLDPSTPSQDARKKTALAYCDTSGEDSDLENQETGKASPLEADNDAALASEGENEDATIRTNNAYPGATNTIGSIHQRHWFLSLDRKNSGFQKGRNGRWVGGWDLFFVKGRDDERSIVTGRLADDVMNDEGVEKFVGRKMWRPILE